MLDIFTLDRTATATIGFVIGLIVASILWRRDIGAAARRIRKQTERFPYKKKKATMSSFEIELLKTLKQVMGADVHVLAKVSLGSIVDVGRTDRATFFANLAAGKSVDFLACDKDKAAPAVAFMVRTKKTADDVDLVREMLRSAGIPLVELQGKQALDPNHVNALIRRAAHVNLDDDEPAGDDDIMVAKLSHS